jgi:hypothetical protein
MKSIIPRDHPDDRAKSCKRPSSTFNHLNAFISDPKNDDFFSFSFTEGLRSLLSLSRRLLCGRSRCSSGVVSAWRRDDCREPVLSALASRDDDGTSGRSRALSPLLCVRLERSPFPEPGTSCRRGELAGTVSLRCLRADSADALWASLEVRTSSPARVKDSPFVSVRTFGIVGRWSLGEPTSTAFSDSTRRKGIFSLCRTTLSLR